MLTNNHRQTLAFKTRALQEPLSIKNMPSVLALPAIAFLIVRFYFPRHCENFRGFYYLNNYLKLVINRLSGKKMNFLLAVNSIKNFPMRRYLFSFLGSFFILINSTGCVQHSSSSPVIAKINNTEITTEQLNVELAANKSLDKANALQNIITRQLFSDAAKLEKLDQNPDVIQEIERQKSVIIANALIHKKIPTSTLIGTKEDILAFYNQHPQLFAERKLWYSTEITFPSNNLTPILKAHFEQATTADQLTQMLYGEHIIFSSRSMTRPTSDFPDNVVALLKNDAKFTIQRDNLIIFVFIHNSSNASLTPEEAKPTIMDYLKNQRFQDKLIALSKEMRATANIEYLDSSLAPDGKKTSSRNKH
jgi:peptidyl-prolyl cis-trans isomerase C